jgi:hypothetical protein
VDRLDAVRRSSRRHARAIEEEQFVIAQSYLMFRNFGGASIYLSLVRPKLFNDRERPGRRRGLVETDIENREETERKLTLEQNRVLETDVIVAVREISAGTEVVLHDHGQAFARPVRPTTRVKELHRLTEALVNLAGDFLVILELGPEVLDRNHLAVDAPPHLFPRTSIRIRQEVKPKHALEVDISRKRFRIDRLTVLHDGIAVLVDVNVVAKEVPIRLVKPDLANRLAKLDIVLRELPRQLMELVPNPQVIPHRLVQLSRLLVVKVLSLPRLDAHSRRIVQDVVDVSLGNALDMIFGKPKLLVPRDAFHLAHLVEELRAADRCSGCR